MAIKRCVSLYSYQEQFYLGKLDLEGCIREVAKTGCKGIEMIPEMNCPKEFRNPSVRFIEQWKEWMEKYGTTPVCIDVFYDYKLYLNRHLTKRELIDMMRENFEFAVKLGFTVVRGMIVVPIPVLESILPMLEYYNLKFGIELHAPVSPFGRQMTELFEMIDRTGTKQAGFVPDMSMFTKKAPKVMMDRFVRKGANQKIVDYISEQFGKRVPSSAIDVEIKKMGANSMDRQALSYLYRIARYDDPEWLTKSVVDKIVHVHGKVYEMDENYVEPSLDYETVIPILEKHGYDQYISTEYEGQRHFHDIEYGPGGADEIEEVRRHQEMLKRMLGE